MSDYQLQPNLYIAPTPYGAYKAVSTSLDSPEKTFLINLLSLWKTPELTNDKVNALANTDTEKAQKLLFQCQEAKLIQGLTKQQIFEDRPLEQSLPEYLNGLSNMSK